MKHDRRKTMGRREFARLVEEHFPEAVVERTYSGELVIFTGWMDDDRKSLRWGEDEREVTP